MTFVPREDYVPRGHPPLHASDLVQQTEGISISIKNQMQMSLQYAEAQEEEFRQMIRLKRRRVETLRQ